MNHADISSKPSRRAQLVVLLVLILAFRAWLFWPLTYRNPLVIASVTAGLVILAVGPLNRLARPLNRLEELCARRRGWVALLVGFAVCGYLLFEAWRFRDLLFLKLHDEHSYMIGAQMLARGRLWMHAYPPDVADFFDSFHLIVDRVYASMYFPGTALAMAPGALLGLRYWVMPLILCAAAAGMFYLVVEELFDGVRGLVAVLMLVSMQWYRWASVSFMSDAPFLLIELVLIWAWLRWRKNHGGGWAALIGAAAGFGAITRPIDTLCFATAIGIAILFELRRQPRVLLRTVGAIVLCATPFLVLQGVQNIGITGRWNQTAEGYYEVRNYPVPLLGFHKFDPARVPVFTYPAKQVYFQVWLLDLLRNHTFHNALIHWYPSHLEQLFRVTLGNSVLIVFVCMAIFGLADIRRLTLVGALILFLAAYFFYLGALDHYLIALIPIVICLVLMGWDVIERTWPNRRAGIRIAMVLLLAAVSISILPELDPRTTPNSEARLFLPEREINRRLDSLPREPAVVLFRFDPSYSVHAEPVYNDSVAWPDDAPVVRARDLDESRNRALYRYYAQRQPDRVFYIYDLGAAPGTDPLSPPLGTARDLAAGL
jgi:hypothetical protein